MNVRKKIGYLWDTKRTLHFDLEDLKKKLQEKNFELMRINPDIPLNPKDKYHIIVHKLSGLIANAKNGNPNSMAYLKDFKTYLRHNPDIFIIDPVEVIEKLIHRNEQYAMLKNALAENNNLFIPSYVEITGSDINENLQKLKNAGLSFPIICKPCIACGIPNAHEMTIIFTETGMIDLNPPCIAQTFINHNAVLYKLYSIGDVFRIVQRRSVKNVYSSHDKKTVRFHSSISRMKPLHIHHWLTILDPEDEDIPNLPLNMSSVQFAHQAVLALGFTLFGIDIIVDNKTGQHGVIDLNSFPGFGGVTDFVPELVNFIERRYTDHLKNLEKE